MSQSPQCRKDSRRSRRHRGGEADGRHSHGRVAMVAPDAAAMVDADAARAAAGVKDAPAATVVPAAAMVVERVRRPEAVRDGKVAQAVAPVNGAVRPLRVSEMSLPGLREHSPRPACLSRLTRMAGF